MANQSRYRYVDWIGGRVVMDREMARLQSIMHGVDANGSQVAFDLSQVYREGATQNIAVTTVGLVVSFTAIDSSKPMVVFVRGRWEVLSGSDLQPITLTSQQTKIYLNYALSVVTADGASGTILDASLVDADGQPAAAMGELSLQVSASDTSGVALNATTQLEKNTSPIVMFEFVNSGSTLTLSVLDNVRGPALAKVGVSGLVSTTTSSPVVVSTNDSRMADARSPVTGSVFDASVRTPTAAGGNNADGTAKYDLAGDIGGISATKIIWEAATVRVSDILAWIKSQLTGIASAVSGHIGASLGTGVHPMPTAGQVGAAPLSHVGLQLGTDGSHPPTVTADSGGYTLHQSEAVTVGVDLAQTPSTDAAYGVLKDGELIAGILHNGDIASSILSELSVDPGGTVNFTGPLKGLFSIAQVLADHVNQKTNKNPHGARLQDLSACAVGPDTLKLGTFIFKWGSVASVAPGPSHNNSLSGTSAVTFDNTVPFNSAPLIFAVPQSNPVDGDGIGAYGVGAYGKNITKDGFTLVEYAPQNVGGSGATFNQTLPAVAWLAIGS